MRTWLMTKNGNTQKFLKINRKQILKKFVNESEQFCLVKICKKQN